jgi:hypothetical protein
MEIESQDFSSYTLTDLEQLLEINKKVLEHYQKILEDHKDKLDHSYFIGTRMCMEQTQIDIQEIEKEISERKK